MRGAIFLKGNIMKAIRSLCALALVLALLFALVGCGGYPAVKSSKEEKATVLTFDGKYDVPYELYRFCFLSELSLSEKDPSQMTEEERTAFLSVINGRALEELAAIYAVLAYAEEYGIDVESSEFDKYVKEGVIAAVEGDETYLGYGGYDEYLAAIKAAYMNDSVFRFLLRYRYAEAKLAAHLRDENFFDDSKETVLAYMNSDECVRVSWIYISYAMLESYTDAELDRWEEEAKAADDEQFLAMTHRVLPDTYTDAQLEIGFYIGRYQLDPYYEALTATSFALEMGETSDWIHSGDGIYLVRRLPKDDEYLNAEASLKDLTEYYMLNEFYGMLAAKAQELQTKVTYSEKHATLTFDTVKMPK